MSEYLGNIGLTKQQGAKYSVARNGLATYDVTYIGNPTANMTFTQGDTSADYSNTVLLSWSFSKADGCQIQIDLHYEGKDNTSDDSVIADITVDASTAAEPVETSPKFGPIILASGAPFPKDLPNGTRVFIHPNGAVFERVSNKFLYFTTYLPDEEGEPDFSTINPKAGMKNYKTPRLTVTRSIIEDSIPSIDGLGLIVDTSGDVDFLPTAPGDRSYILDKVRVRNIANVYYEVQETYLLSGPRGWDTDFYTD